MICPVTGTRCESTGCTVYIDGRCGMLTTTPARADSAETPTPETDDRAEHYADYGMEFVPADFARSLERRLATLQGELEEARAITGADVWAEVYRLRAAIKGPDGFASWQDAATDERIRRVAAESALRASHDARVGAQETVGRLHEACVTYMRLSLLARGYWDDDKDMRVGKLLIAMSGLLPGYRADLDQIHLLLRQVGNGIIDAALSAAAEREGGEMTVSTLIER